MNNYLPFLGNSKFSGLVFKFLQYNYASSFTYWNDKQFVLTWSWLQLVDDILLDVKHEPHIYAIWCQSHEVYCNLKNATMYVLLLEKAQGVMRIKIIGGLQLGLVKLHFLKGNACVAVSLLNYNSFFLKSETMWKEKKKVYIDVKKTESKTKQRKFAF